MCSGYTSFPRRGREKLWDCAIAAQRTVQYGNLCGGFSRFPTCGADGFANRPAAAFLHLITEKGCFRKAKAMVVKMGFGLGFDFFGIMFSIVFILVIGVFVFAAVRMLRTWNKNNRSPRLTVPAQVAAKRAEVSHHHHTNAGQNAGFGMTSVTRYYATFEFESGDRMELAVDASEYGLLAEGDVGRLRFQGTRFLAFERNI